MLWRPPPWKRRPPAPGTPSVDCRSALYVNVIVTATGTRRHRNSESRTESVLLLALGLVDQLSGRRIHVHAIPSLWQSNQRSLFVQLRLLLYDLGASDSC
jgi:hypothetical protein